MNTPLAIKDSPLNDILSRASAHNDDLYRQREKVAALLVRLRGSHPATNDGSEKAPEPDGLLHEIEKKQSAHAYHIGALAADIDELIQLL